MVTVKIASAVSLLYIGLLFAVAYIVDKKRETGQSITANSSVYSLTIPAYFTSWTFYGLIGQAATTGIQFIATYLGTTLIAFTWWFLLRKMVRICKEQNILSIADFIASRYGKSPLLGGIVTVFSILAIIPYIALQLKAITVTFNILTRTSLVPISITVLPIDNTFIVALLLGIFGILFGARHHDESGRLEGLMAAVALQSIVKLIALITVGLFVTYGLFDGFGDIFSRFTAMFPEKSNLFVLGNYQNSYSMWFAWLLAAMMSIMFLPRQFHIMVIENSNEEHIKDAMWQFPLYTFLLVLFIMPMALAGLILNGGDPRHVDFLVLDLPLRTGHPWLAMFVFIGGFSASAGMVIVESVVLSTMILNHLAIPAFLKIKIDVSDISRWLITTKRVGIIAVVLLGYWYGQFISTSSTLTDIGRASLVAATQFAPAIIGGMYWKRATRNGAAAGLFLGFFLWFYTMLIPIFVQSGWLVESILQNGPFNIALLRPLELFGLKGFEPSNHALFWTMFFNLGSFVIISLLTGPKPNEVEQAENFVNVFRAHDEPVRRKRMTKAPATVEFLNLMTKFIGEKQAHAAMTEYLADKEIDAKGNLSEFELPILKRHTEQILARSVGAAAAGIIVDSYLAAQGSELEDVFDVFGTVSLSRSASREQLGILYETERIVSSKTELQVILDRILELFQQQFKFDICVIRTLDEESRCLTVKSHRGMSAGHLEESDRELSMETYSGAAFLTSSATVVNDADIMEKPISAHLARQEGIKSFAHVPIMIEGNPVGVFSAFSKTMKGIFTDEFLELFRSLGGQIGIALRNARQSDKLIKAKEHEKEMQIARTIQLGLLPTRAPEIEGITLAGTCIPAREVGGDYYDILPRNESSLDLVIADVSGHNVGAALLMAEVRTLIQAESKRIQTPANMLAALNEFLYEDLSRAELFITMCYMSYDTKRRRLSFANAGHNPPIIWRSKTQSCELLDADGLILGVMQHIVFEEKHVQIDPGDILFLYTDGITEAANSDGTLFGEDRLCTVLKTIYTLTPEQIINELVKIVRSFAATESLSDDVTIVVMKAG